MRVSRRFVTPLPHGWLTSFTRSALILALSSMRGLRDAVLRPGSASLRLRPLRSAPPDAEALSWLGGLGAGSWALMLGGGVFLPDLGAQLLVYPN